MYLGQKYFDPKLFLHSQHQKQQILVLQNIIQVSQVGELGLKIVVSTLLLLLNDFRLYSR